MDKSPDNLKIKEIEPLDDQSRNSGVDADDIAEVEIDHFGNCPVCGALIDMRDLAQLLAHVHDAEIEIEVGPAPPPRAGPVQ